MSFTFSASGFQQLERRLQALSREDATKAGQSANRAGAAVLKKKIEETAPVSNVAEGATITRRNKDGSTRQETHHKISQNVKIKKVRSGEGTVENLVFISKAYHATFVEFGSIHNAPTPFMLNALEGNKDDIIEAMRKSLNRNLVRRGA